MTGWIARTVRLPTAKDADAQNCVLYWHKYQGTMVLGWHQMAHNEFLTHWMPTPEGPEKEQKNEEEAEAGIRRGGGHP